MSKKIHLYGGFDRIINHYFTPCKTYSEDGENYVKFKDFINTPPEKRCKRCEATTVFQELKAKHESKRPLEKEEFEEPRVNPPQYNPENVAFKTTQQADHYKQGVETIEKIETILTMLGDEITPREGYLIGNFIKYIDRLGLKDDKKKDAYKASDYLNRLISSKWIHEK